MVVEGESVEQGDDVGVRVEVSEDLDFVFGIMRCWLS